MTAVVVARPKTTVSALSVEKVSHAYGARIALDEVSFDVAPASFTVLLGLNGAGKSTLFSVITHLYVSRSGVVQIFGRDVARESGAALALLGVVFQQRTLDPDLSRRAKPRLSRRLARNRAARNTRATGRATGARRSRRRAHDKVRYLSGGQMRRVEIARALLHRPRMLLLDEPTAGLDIKARADILEIVRGLVADEGIGVLWATHLVDEIRDDDHVVVLHEGRVLADGPSRSIVMSSGAASIGAAFTALTGDGREGGKS